MNLMNLEYKIIASVEAPTMIRGVVDTMRYTLLIGFKPEVIHDEEDVEASVAAIAVVRDSIFAPMPTDVSGDSLVVEFLHEEAEFPSVLDALRDNGAVEVLLEEARSCWFRGTALMQTLTMSSLFQASVMAMTD